MRSLQAAVLLVAIGLSSTALGSDLLMIFKLSELSGVCSQLTTLIDAASRSAARAECERHSDCHHSYVCNAAKQCVRPAAAASSSRCPAGMVCDAAAGGSSLRRQASELYLRERVVELREELALGRGPVISSLAVVEGVPARELGRALRENRAELVALIGDGAGAEWSASFLTRVHQLCGRA